MKVIAGERYGIKGRFVFLFVFNGWHSACLHSQDSCIVEESRVRLREAVQEWFGKSFLDPTSSHSSSQCSGGRDGDRIGTASKSPFFSTQCSGLLLFFVFASNGNELCRA